MAAGTTHVEHNSDQLARAVLKAGLLIIGALAAADIILNHYKVLPSPLRRSFNIAREDSIGTWFAVVQVLAVSAMAFMLYRGAKALDLPASTRRIWAGLSLFFLYMSIDDASELHERLGSTFQDEVTFFPSYAWQAIFAPIFGFAGLVLLYVAWRVLEDKASKRAIVFGLFALTVAVALDFAEGVEDLASSIADSLGWEEQTVSHFQKVAEESIEMAGITLFLSAFVRHFGRVVGGASIRFNNEAID